MSNRLFIRDQAQIDASKVETDTDPIHGPTTVFKDVVIASEIVHQYEDGWAYKPADELEKAYWTWEGRWAKADDHPETGIIMTVDGIQGKTTNVRFVKNLNDHKTGRPNRRGILADLTVFDRKVAPETLAAMKSGSKRDVSIGFFFTKDETPGSWNGADYSYIQRSFMGDHTAFALDLGRCTFPTCGIGADKLITSGDPFAGYEDFADCVAKNQDKDDPEAYCGSIKHKVEDEETHKLDTEAKLSMEKIDKLKSKLSDVLSSLDDLVEEEYQGNVTNMTPSERAMMFFSINEETWDGLSEEEKEDYISRLPPEKERAGGEELSDRDCVYEWENVREKILDIEWGEPVFLSKILGEMEFDNGNVTMSTDTVDKLKEHGVDLEPCECEEDEEEEEVEEEDEVTEEEAEADVQEVKELPSTDEILKETDRVLGDLKRIVG